MWYMQLNALLLFSDICQMRSSDNAILLANSMQTVIFLDELFFICLSQADKIFSDITLCTHKAADQISGYIEIRLVLALDST